MSDNSHKYINFKVDGRLFPSWILYNFKTYTLPEVLVDPNSDPCQFKSTGKKQLRKYQEFLVKYLDYGGPYKNILLYHGLGSGKTAITINIYNMLFNYTPGWNVFLLIKASLKNDPWLQELEQWLEKDDKDIRFKNIKFVHYDSPFADKDFADAVRNSDSANKNMYIIDEGHNFIRNVYSNLNSKSGRRAINIYNSIQQDVKENDSTRVILISGTPAINVPYELALVFNLLRPGSFPESENKFNQKYVTYGTYSTINPASKNKFMRRIIGLVSYYIGSTPDTFATSTLKSVSIPMGKYQEDVYNFYEIIEAKIEAKRQYGESGSEMYRAYTRQACNFVFPPISQKINGESRPRPNNFRITEKEALAIDIGKETKLKAEKFGDKIMNVSSYLESLELFLTNLDKWFADKHKEDASLKHTLHDDVKNFTEGKQSVLKWWNSQTKKSNLLQGMYMCGPKFVHMILNSLRAKGPTVIYTNYVRMEGIDIIKIYLKYFDFSGYDEKKKKETKYCYGEFHGAIINRETRQKTKLAFNSIENIKGEVIKIILFSPAGTEGISLANVRQMHITEPYWNEVRIRQMIGRALRQCSHKDLPLQERHVDIFRYKMVRIGEGKKITTDEHIEQSAKNKDTLLQTFYMALKEIAIDCKLNKAHNMMSGEYDCFDFDEQNVFKKQGEEANISKGPAYKEDDFDDDKIETGMYSENSIVKTIKVIEINAVKLLSADKEKYSKSDKYWYYSENGTVYDYELKFPIGKIKMDENNLPHKLDKDTYIIDYLSIIALHDPLF